MDGKCTEAVAGATPENTLHFEDLLKLLNALPAPPVYLIHPDRLCEVRDALGYWVEQPVFDRPAQRKMFVVDGVQFIICQIFPKDILRIEDRELIKTVMYEWENGIATRLIDQLWVIKR